MPSEQRTSQIAAGVVIASRYEVVKTLGVGGMGTVVQVIDRALDDEMTALKILAPQHVEDATQFGRFRNEVLLARKLSHPHIVRVYDFGAAGGGYFYISMEYVPAGAITKKIYGRGVPRISFEETCLVLLQLCSALACAHGQGVVHRDLKPDNILLTEKGYAKVTDFGLARSLDFDKNFTMTGETVGTPFYMSPEQLAGERPDRRVDIYSLGIMAFEMVIGRRPFVSENYLELAHMHMNQPLPDVCKINPSIPKWFGEFVQVAASKHMDDRFSSASEAGDFLREYAKDVAVQDTQYVPAVLSLQSASAVRKGKGSGMGSVLSKLALLTAVMFAACYGVIWTMLLTESVPSLHAVLLRRGVPVHRLFPFTADIEQSRLGTYVAEQSQYSVGVAVMLIPDPTRSEEVARALVSGVQAYTQGDLQNEKFFKENIELFAVAAVRDALFLRALSSDYAAFVDFMIKNSLLEVEAPLSSGRTPLEQAILSGAAESVRMLLTMGASPLEKTADGYELTGLAKAVLPEVTPLMVQYGGDVNARTAKIAKAR